MCVLGFLWLIYSVGKLIVGAMINIEKFVS